MSPQSPRFMAAITSRHVRLARAERAALERAYMLATMGTGAARSPADTGGNSNVNDALMRALEAAVICLITCGVVGALAFLAMP